MNQKMQMVQELIDQQKEKDPEFGEFWNQLETPELDEHQDGFLEQKGVNPKDKGPELADFLKVLN